MSSSQKGIIYVLMSAVFFSLGGILVKMIPWSSVSINSARSFLALGVIAVYMKLRHHGFVFNKSVFLGAVCNSVMSLTFVMATKMTSAANAIVLQFTEPIFVILLLWLVFHNRPGKEAVLTCVVAFAGMVCFFFEQLTPSGMVGNLLAILSGFTYAVVFLMKKMPGGDMESALIVSLFMNVLVGLPGLVREQVWNPEVLIFMLILGIVQFGLSYICLSNGLDRVTPVTASITSMIEPVLNPILVAVFYGETIGRMAVLGTVLVIGATTAYNVWQNMPRTDG